MKDEFGGWSTQRSVRKKGGREAVKHWLFIYKPCITIEKPKRLPFVINAAAWKMIVKFEGFSFLFAHKYQSNIHTGCNLYTTDGYSTLLVQKKH